MVVHASESTFAKTLSCHHASPFERIDVKREHQRLKVKAMECAGLIGNYPLSLNHIHNRL